MPELKTVIATALTGATAVLTLAACSGSSATSETPSNVSQPSGMPQGQFPGANGLIASVSGSTLQVQGQEAQTAVTYSGSTAITATKSVALSAAKVGDCVSANGSQVNAAVNASTIRVTQPVNGECAAAGPAGGLPGRPGGGTPPSGMPGGGTPPSGAPGAGAGGSPGAGFTVASGKVTAVSAAGLTLSGQLLTMGAGASPSPSQGQVIVNAGADTTVSKEVQATSTALVVGKCARAIGEANDKGTIAAASINVSEPVDGKCQLGFRGAPQ